MKILITGASGFIGRYLANHLQGDITSVTRRDVDLTDGIAVREQLRSNRYDVVVNCAAQGRNQAQISDPTIVSNNLVSWGNLYSNLEEFGMLINLGTGAEFDISKPIEMATEQDIWTRNPIQSYGLSKNLISRMMTRSQQCYTVRIFGCFDDSEESIRPIQKLRQKAQAREPFVIEQDRWFDTISLMDLTRLIQSIAKGLIPRAHDINAVYADKTRLSDILRLYCKLHNFDTELVQVKSHDGPSYTGDGTTLQNSCVELLGLEESLKRYGNK